MLAAKQTRAAGRRRTSWVQKQAWDLGADDAKRCRCEGPGLFRYACGSFGGFSVETFDENDDRLDAGGLRFNAALENDSHRFELEVEDLRDGTYACEYRHAPPPGAYELSVLLRDEFHVEGSPFTCVVRAGPAAARARGAGAGI